jgi:hypothetical protein
VSQSNGKIRKATPKEAALHEKYIEADKASKRAKAAMKILDSELRSMVGNANGIERVLILQQKTQSDVLDEDAFLAELNEKQKKLCQKKSMSNNGNPSIIGKIGLKSFNKELDEKVKVTAKGHPSKFPLSNKKNLPRAIDDKIKFTHMEFLRSKRAIKTLEWEMKQIEVLLANSLGSDEGIEGIISWRRSKPIEETIFSKPEAKKHFPELFATHCTGRPDHIAVKIAEGHPYQFE